MNESTIYAALILLVAIATAVLWNALDTVDPAVRSFLSEICKDHETYCNSDVLRPTRRTQKTIRDLVKGQRLVEIPRHLLLWDLDALRDEFVRQELFPARIFGQQALEADVFLAAYIALLQHNKSSLLSPVLQRYLDILPTYNDFAQFHPLVLLENNSTIRSALLGISHTYTAQLIRHKQQMLRLEYQSLTNASHAFATQCSWLDFVTARLAVLTRSFGTGRLRENERDHSHHHHHGDEKQNGRVFESLDAEMAFYRQEAGVDLSSGSFAMVPILDLYNHHARPIVGYSYDPVKRAFVIRSLTGLNAGQELWDSYGRHSDPHLYSKFGFVNGDGSESTQASLAAFHRLLVLPNETRQEELLRYLSFDDGYQECVQPQEGEPAWELKRLKYQHLQAMAHDARFWTVVVGPRQKEARPAASSATSAHWPRRDVSLLVMDPKQVEAPDVKGPVGLCRLLVATHQDFDGRAIQLLRDNLAHAGSYILPQPPPQDACEYRTLRCLERLASQSLARFPNSIPHVQARLAEASATLADATRTEWSMAHLELGELQTLDLIRGMATTTIRQGWPSHVDREGPLFLMRQKPCHPTLLEPLLNR